MYHVTTSTGLTEDADTPTAAVELLRAQLLEHLGDGPVSWKIFVDGLEDCHAGGMRVPPGERNYDAGVDEHVQQVRVNLIVELHDTAEAARRPNLTGQDAANAARPDGGSAASVGGW